MKLPVARILPFHREPGEGEWPKVGRVHSDGSITYLGVTYATIKELPPECVALRPDQETYTRWKRLYRAIEPKARRRSWAPHQRTR